MAVEFPCPTFRAIGINMWRVKGTTVELQGKQCPQGRWISIGVGVGKL